MREDQIERLRELEEKLLDVYLDEADPANWPGFESLVDGEPLTKQQRGDRYWEKKNAIATVALAFETRKLLVNEKPALGRDPYSERELDQKIAAAERNAEARLKLVQSGKPRAEFLKRAAGDS